MSVSDSIEVLNTTPFYSPTLPKSIFLDRYDEFKFSVIMAINRAFRDISSQGLSFSLGDASYIEVLTTKTIDYAEWKIRYDVTYDYMII
jgi:hypothetical protein